MALRSINLLTAATIMAEIGELQRFANAPPLMAYLGVVSSAYSSGGITKTGNVHVRRVLAEAAWTYRHPARKTIGRHHLGSRAVGQAAEPVTRA